jgi:hypothetical protein
MLHDPDLSLMLGVRVRHRKRGIGVVCHTARTHVMCQPVQFAHKQAHGTQ